MASQFQDQTGRKMHGSMGSMPVSRYQSRGISSELPVGTPKSKIPPAVFGE